MRRWHSEVALMTRRQNFEIVKHGDRTTGETFQCHCLDGIGTMRKHRPNESCGDTCSLCDHHRFYKRVNRRQQRRLLKSVNDPVEFYRLGQYF